MTMTGISAIFQKLKELKDNTFGMLCTFFMVAFLATFSCHAKVQASIMQNKIPASFVSWLGLNLDYLKKY